MIMTNENGIYQKDIEEYYCEEVESLGVNLGYGLIPLVEEENGGDLCERLSKARETVSEETGIPIPRVRIRDRRELKKLEYSLLFKGAEVGRWTFMEDYTLFVVTDEKLAPEIKPSWKKTIDPAFGVDAYFIPDEEAVKMEHKVGFILVPPAAVISNHLREIILKNRDKFLNHYYVNQLVEKVRRKNEALVSEVFFNRKFTITDLKLILNRLVAEKVPINDMNTILETIADYLREEDNPIQLAEKVRERLALVYLQKYADEKNVLHVIKVPHSVSEILAEHIYEPDSRVEIPFLNFGWAGITKFTKALSKSALIMTRKEFIPVFLCVSAIRIPLAEYIVSMMPGAICVSDKECLALNNALEIKAEGELSFDEEKD